MPLSYFWECPERDLIWALTAVVTKRWLLCSASPVVALNGSCSLPTKSLGKPLITVPDLVLQAQRALPGSRNSQVILKEFQRALSPTAVSIHLTNAHWGVLQASYSFSHFPPAPQICSFLPYLLSRHPLALTWKTADTGWSFGAGVSTSNSSPTVDRLSCLILPTAVWWAINPILQNGETVAQRG